MPTDLVITDKNIKILIITAYKSIQIKLKNDLNIAKYILINYLRDSKILGANTPTFYLQKNKIPNCCFPNSLGAYDYCESKFFLDSHNKLKVFLAKKQAGPVENIT